MIKFIHNFELFNKTVFQYEIGDFWITQPQSCHPSILPAGIHFETFCWLDDPEGTSR